MTTWVYIAASLDGYIAAEDGSIDWLTGLDNPSNDDYGYAEFMKGIDGLVMGRGTFETVLTFPAWPYTKKVFVLSNGMATLPAHLAGKAELLSKPPREVLTYLAGHGHQSLYIDGGETIRRFLKEDLIDEIIVTTVPVLLGRGRPLFGETGALLRLTHVSTITYPNGLVKNHFRRDRTE